MILISIQLFNSLNAQVYHHITNKIIPNARAGQLIKEGGIFLGYDADYCTLIVPENRKNPKTKLINIPVVIIHCYGDTELEPVFLLNGGPGISNIWYRNFPEYLLENHDIVMVGYRGVEGSVILQCSEIKKIIKTKNIFSERNSNMISFAWQREANKFVRNLIDIEGYSMREVIQDIENVREALFYTKISIYAFSYGTMLSQFYSYHFQENIEKLVLIGTRPFGYYLHDPKIIEDKLLKLIDNLKLTNEISEDNFNPGEVLRDIHNKNFEGNWKFEESKFELAAFLHLYNYRSSKYLINSLIEAKNGDYTRVKAIYNTFNSQFTTDLVLGDFAVKTSCSLNFHVFDSAVFFPKVTPKNTGHYLTESMNKWYLSFDLCYKEFDLEYQLMENNISTLFISAEYDFVAPYEYVKNSLLQYYEKSEFFLVPNVGHDDLIKNNSRFIQNKIASFLKQEN